VLLLHGCERLGSGGGATRGTVLEIFAAVILLAAFSRHALRLGRLALVDLGLFSRKTFAAAASTQFLSNAIVYGGQMLLPLYFLGVCGRTPAEVGLLLVPLGIGAMCLYPWMGALTERFGPRVVSAGGAALALVGTLPFALSGTAMSTTAIAVTLFVRGAGLASINIPSIAAAYSGIDKPLIPVATTALNIAQRLGGPAMTTLVAVFLHARMVAASGAVANAYAATFWLLCAVHAATVLAALRLPVEVVPRQR
jgi:Na+/melibiose symporter-like transporter